MNCLTHYSSGQTVESEPMIHDTEFSVRYTVPQKQKQLAVRCQHLYGELRFSGVTGRHNGLSGRCEDDDDDDGNRENILLTCNVIDDDCNGRVTDVWRNETTEAFLTGRVPQLQSDLQHTSPGVRYGTQLIFQFSKIISVLVSIKFEINHFSISFYTVSELFSVLVSIKFFLEIISVQFQFKYLHHFSNSFVIDNIRTQEVEFREGVSPSQWGRGLVKGLSEIFFGFFASKWCILRAFWHMIRQFKKIQAKANK